jgi:hypothetical protein
VAANLSESAASAVYESAKNYFGWDMHLHE